MFIPVDRIFIPCLRFCKVALVSLLLCGLPACTVADEVDPRADQAAPAGERTREQLEALGYLTGYQQVPKKSGVTVYLPDLACPGYNLYTSGHEQAARLVDMEGNLVHRWEMDHRTAFSLSKPDRAANRSKFPYWRRVHLFPNGDLLAIINYNGLIKIDKDSNLIWSVRRLFHHDLHLGPDGMIHALTYKKETIPRINENHKLRNDYITILSQEGIVLREISLLEVFENSSYSSFLRHMPQKGDVLHTNTIEVFDGSQAHRSPLFRKGNVLVSMRSIDVIAIIDPEQKEVVWALSGQWIAQHQPTLLPNGNILLFDNRGHNGMSKVIEFHPFTQEIVWAYEGDEENGFYTRSLGSNHRLPNGNTLIVESESGRVFEVTPQKQVVWEFLNPASPSEDKALIATIFEMTRLDQAFPLDWLFPPK